MNVALYCRVSTDEQKRTGESILDQRQALERWANENGHAVAGVYADDGFSAHKSYNSRPELRRLLDDVQRGGVELIAFTKFDRWTRKAADYYELQEFLDRARVPWCAILEDYETVTADGRFKVGIMLSVNQHEAERTSERIKFTFQEKRRRGEIVSGKMPRGYILKDKKPVKDPETEAGMVAFWRTYLDGRGLNAAISAANASNLRLSVSGASFILSNANAYTGAIQGVLCDAYISEQEAEKVLASRKTRSAPSGHVYLFAGIIYCGECGGRFGGHRHFWKHKDGTHGVNIYYNCSRRYKTVPHECQNSANIYESDIERALLYGMPGAIEAEAARVETRNAQQRYKANESDGGEKLRAKLERKKRRAWAAYLDESIELDEYKRTAAEIDKQLAAIPAPEIIDEDAPRRIREALPPRWREIYADLDALHRREVWRQFIERIDIMANRAIRITLKPGGHGFTTRIQQPDGYWIEVVKAKE